MRVLPEGMGVYLVVSRQSVITMLFFKRAEKGKLYYDRHCRLCQRLAKWIYRWSLSKRLQLVPTDYTELSKLPLPVEAVMYQRGDKIWIKSEAIRRVLWDGGWLLPAFVLWLIPLQWRDRWYDWVALRRSCKRPPEANRLSGEVS